MIRGETSTGFAFEIDERITQDIRFVRICRKIYSEDTRKRGRGLTISSISFFRRDLIRRKSCSLTAKEMELSLLSRCTPNSER